VFENKINRINWLWNVKNSCIWVYRTDIIFTATSLIETEKPKYISRFSKQKIAVMASDGPSPNLPSLRLGLDAHHDPSPNLPSLCLALAAHQPSRCHHAQSLLGPSFHDPGTPHDLESHPEQVAPLSRRDDERRHAVGSHPALEPRIYLAACNPSSSCHLWVWDHLCSNLSQPFYSFWITKIRSVNLCVYVCVFTFACSTFTFLIEMSFNFKSLFAIWSLSPRRFYYCFYLGVVSWKCQKYWTILILLLCLLCVTHNLCPAFNFLQQLITKGLWRIYTYTCSPMFSIDVVVAAPDDLCICW